MALREAKGGRRRRAALEAEIAELKVRAAEQLRALDELQTDYNGELRAQTAKLSQLSASTASAAAGVKEGAANEGGARAVAATSWELLLSEVFFLLCNTGSDFDNDI